MNTKEQKRQYKIAKLTRIRALCEKLLKQLPEGNLLMSEKNGRRYYTLYLDRHSHYLRVGDPRIQQLQDRYLVEQTLKAVTEQLALLEMNSALRVPFDPNELIPTFPAAYQKPSTAIIRAMGFQDARTWGKESYNRSKKHPEDLKVTTRSGLIVRSRIEGSITEIYEDAGIPFRYEEKLKLPSGEEIHPDFHPMIFGVFTIKRHEHCGKMNDSNYVKWDFLHRRDQYLRAGLIPGQDVLFTFDGADGEVDLPSLRKQILDWVEFCRNE